MGNCYACVAPDELMAVEYLGKFQDIKGSGCHVFGPDFGGICYQTRTITTRIVEQRVVCDTKTKDNVFVHVSIAVQREVIRHAAYDAFYKLTNVDHQVDSYVADVVRAQVPKLLLDDLFESKDDIAAAIKVALQKSMEGFGVFIHQALVVDIVPDGKVKAAMNEINANRRLRIATEEKAEANRIVLVKQAEAESESKFLQGRGIARQRSAIVDGLRTAIGGSEGALNPEKVSELLMITQYFDTLEKMAANGHNTSMFIPHSLGSVGDMSSELRNSVMQSAAVQGQVAGVTGAIDAAYPVCST